MNLSEKLRQFAFANGIEYLGIIDAEPLYEFEPYLEECRQRKIDPPFVQNSISQRINPRLSLPGCQSIICLVLPYLPDYNKITEAEPEEPVGLLSKIAQVRDYHQVMSQKANQIVEYLQEITSPIFNYLIHVDTGPLLERAFLQKAGLITGENTTLITPKYGSWVVVGLILLDIQLPSLPLEQTYSETCHNCGLCRQACPTGALLAPYQLNPWHCLSYISQMKGIIPREYRNLLENRLYGCDTCQEVCPLNHDIKPSILPEFSSPILLPKLPLLTLSHINKKEFFSLIKPTAAGWVGRQTLRRNAIVAMGNSKFETTLPYLREILYNDRSYLMRNHAAWALGQFNELPKVREYLQRALLLEKDPRVIEEIKYSLQKS